MSVPDTFALKYFKGFSILGTISAKAAKWKTYLTFLKEFCHSPGTEISALINEKIDTKVKVKRLGIVDAPIPSTRSLAKYSYIDDQEILDQISLILGVKIKLKEKFKLRLPSDQPGKDFTGPF